MSSIRLFILGSLDERGPMHGHGLRHLAEKEHIDEWTDFTVGAVYGAIKRLALEGLIAEERVEREGHYPERQVYAITDAGRYSLGRLRTEALTEIAIKADPFDLGLARLDFSKLDELPGIVAERIETMRERIDHNVMHHEQISQYLTAAEKWSLDHQADRWRAELAWHERLLGALPEIITDEQNLKSTKGHH